MRLLNLSNDGLLPAFPDPPTITNPVAGAGWGVAGGCADSGGAGSAVSPPAPWVPSGQSWGQVSSSSASHRLSPQVTWGVPPEGVVGFSAVPLLFSVASFPLAGWFLPQSCPEGQGSFSCSSPLPLQ